MDNELQEMLVKILEGQNRLETKVSGIENKVTGLEVEVKKNSIKLEIIEKKIDIIAELQTAHKEQNKRGFEKALEEQGNTNTLVISSLKVVSDDVTEIKADIKELKEKFDKVEKVTIQNTYDVAYLKSAK